MRKERDPFDELNNGPEEFSEADSRMGEETGSAWKAAGAGIEDAGVAGAGVGGAGTGKAAGCDPDGEAAWAPENGETALTPEEREARDHRKQAEFHRKQMKLSLRTFLVTGLSLIAVLVVCIVTFAWFYNMKVVEGSGMTVNAKKTITLQMGTFDFYKYDKETGTYLEYEGSKAYKYVNGVKTEVQTSDAFVTKGSQLVLPLTYYDALLPHNENTSIFVRIPISGTILTNASVDTIIITMTCDENATWATGALGEESGYFSNVIRLRCAPLPTVDSGYDSAADKAEHIYTGAAAAFAALDSTGSTFMRFVNLPASTSETPTYVTGHKLSFEMDQDDFHFDSSSKEEYGYVYVEVDYDPDLVLRYLGLDDEKVGLNRRNIDAFAMDTIKTDLSYTGTNLED